MPLAVPGTRDEARHVRVFGRVGPPRRHVCHDRTGPAVCGLGAGRSAQTGGVRPPAAFSARGREPGRAPLRGAESYEAER